MLTGATGKIRILTGRRFTPTPYEAARPPLEMVEGELGGKVDDDTHRGFARARECEAHKPPDLPYEKPDKVPAKLAANIGLGPT